VGSRWIRGNITFAIIRRLSQDSQVYFVVAYIEGSVAQSSGQTPFTSEIVGSFLTTDTE
jgi:hypothetical protein